MSVVSLVYKKRDSSNVKGKIRDISSSPLLSGTDNNVLLEEASCGIGRKRMASWKMVEERPLFGHCEAPHGRGFDALGVSSSAIARRFGQTSTGPRSGAPWP